MDHRRLPTNFEGAFTAAYRFFQAPVIAGELIYNKVFDRFPDLKVVFAEVDCAWVPYLKEQMDDRIVRQNPKNRLQIKRRPGEYFERNMFYTIVIDSFGIRVRHEVGIDQIMWSNDYPHATCDWPDDWKTIERHFAGVPEDEKHKILAGTAAGLYGFNRRNLTPVLAVTWPRTARPRCPIESFRPLPREHHGAGAPGKNREWG